MRLADLQAELKELTRGIEHPRVGSALALAEECGEVMRCVLDREYYGKDVAKDLEGEVGDVLVALCELCDRFDVSLEAAASGAVAKIRRKAPQWKAELGDRLVRLRERMDGPT
jgi:NTP pyrophosphatase (non-canonical NTP hydrolase)